MLSGPHQHLRVWIEQIPMPPTSQRFPGSPPPASKRQRLRSNSSETDNSPSTRSLTMGGDFAGHHTRSQGPPIYTEMADENAPPTHKRFDRPGELSSSQSALFCFPFDFLLRPGLHRHLARGWTSLYPPHIPLKPSIAFPRQTEQSPQSPILVDQQEIALCLTPICSTCQNFPSDHLPPFSGNLCHSKQSGVNC